MGHQLDPEQVEELERLMKEYPDWKEQFPEIAAQIDPPRFHKSRKSKHQANERVVPRRAVTVPASDYQSTFKYHNQRPRSSKRPPPPGPHSDRSQAPMNFSTNMKADYIPKDLSVRPQPIVLKECYEHPTGPFQGLSTYNQAYKPNEIHPLQTIHPHPTITQGQMKAQAGTFDCRTTNKETYKKWNHKPAIKFTELPTFTGSILYPGHEHNMESTTKTTFAGKRGERADPIRNDQAHIQLEGEHDMCTTTKNTYKKFDSARPAEKVVNKPQILKRRDPFSAQTQTMKDYSYKSGAAPRQAIQPHPETIQLRFNDKQDFATEANSKYRGVDVTTHPPPRPILPHSESENYPVAEHTIEMESQARRDYRPHDVSESYVPPVKNTFSESTNYLKRQEALPKFHSETSNKHFYKKWQVEPRKRFIDFHEGHKYIPPSGHFEGESTTKSTFVKKVVKVSDPFLPIENSVTGEGSMDLNTMYRVTFNNQSPLTMLKKPDLNKLLHNLRRRKNQEGQFQERSVMFAQDVGAK